MNLRFLKKKNGEKILQEYDHSSMEYKDIPMVEECHPTPSDKLHKALKGSLIHGNYIILVNKKFYEELVEEDRKRTGVFHSIKKINSFYNHRIYVVEDMFNEFKIVKENL